MMNEVKVERSRSGNSHCPAGGAAYSSSIRGLFLVAGHLEMESSWVIETSQEKPNYAANMSRECKKL
jgi:hypothetical protein